MKHHNHWHTFRYAGKAYTDPQRRRGEAPSTFPPFAVKDFLSETSIKHAGTVDRIPAALDWLKQGATSSPPVDGAQFLLEERLAWADRTLGLERGADIIWGYYTNSQVYVSLSVIACPRRPHEACPIGFQDEAR
ncbi:hypothetical protein P8A18_12625 [Streptomyces castrisilvae]|uniref:Uncharacterized protein n=1 Tax=Streptomyces castrisilvae TaxID=3033811 RepID=A0ABY9HI70_9ACTN|nr:hypothetical protein [Streptomyces sp. Mut1]WLQ34230.1 hypothetical protein P8A18_12625 [Streptomyces sp. Mut1]